MEYITFDGSLHGFNDFVCSFKRSHEEQVRHNKEVEKHNRFLRDEISRKNRTMEISIMVSRAAFEEMNKWKRIEAELKKVTEGLHVVASDFLKQHLMSDSGYATRNAIKDVCVEIGLLKKSKKMERLILHGENNNYVIDFIICVLCLKHIVDGYLLEGKSIPLGEDKEITLCGCSADEFLQAKKYRQFPMDVYESFCFIQNGYRKIVSTDDFSKKLLNLFTEKSSSKSNDSIPAMVKRVAEKCLIVFSNDEEIEVPTEVLEEGWDIIQEHTSIWINSLRCNND